MCRHNKTDKWHVTRIRCHRSAPAVETANRQALCASADICFDLASPSYVDVRRGVFAIFSPSCDWRSAEWYIIWAVKRAFSIELWSEGVRYRWYKTTSTLDKFWSISLPRPTVHVQRFLKRRPVNRLYNRPSIVLPEPMIVCENRVTFQH